MRLPTIAYRAADTSCKPCLDTGLVRKRYVSDWPIICAPCQWRLTGAAERIVPRHASNVAERIKASEKKVPISAAQHKTLELIEAAFADDAEVRPVLPASLHVERVSGAAMVGYQTAWTDLCARSMESNVFLEPGFALPLIQHTEGGRRPEFLLVWEDCGSTAFGRLVGLLPIAPGQPLSRQIVSGFHHKQATLGTPLLDRQRGEEVFDAMLDWLGERGPNASALLLTKVLKGGAFHTMAAHLCQATDRRVLVLEEHERAVLRRQPPGDDKVTWFTSAKRRKELGRQRRRLEERGQKVYTSARTPTDIALATERFLALEHNGWKGDRGTALLADPTLATFTRSMTRLMAHEGKCRIDAIEIDGVPVAMGIIISVGDRAHYWKTTFHEAFAPLSPGVQFTLDLTQAQLSDPDVVLTDSCAMPDHSMINRLWPDRIAITDLMFDLQPENPSRLLRARWIENARRKTKAKIKQMLRLVTDRWS